jgi:hypothetical protein
MITTRFYFEKLSPGLRAKLDANFRINQRPFGVFNTGIIRRTFETGTLSSKQAGILQTPITQAR